MCGGTAPAMTSAMTLAGLSPRVRGNRAFLPHQAGQGWSIPACAGEPPAVPGGAAPRPVYPRVCGGTFIRRGSCINQLGLSPRVRGNLPRMQVSPEPVGSIPACAGEPAGRQSETGHCEVYPRVCGGTPDFLPLGLPIQGLSPRVRGNPGDMGRRPRRAGSIPACAGEPPWARPVPAGRRVYPRVCGGTFHTPVNTKSYRGLSPRVRGNLLGDVLFVIDDGSIPACAGEPLCSTLMLPMVKVYPRVCGGTRIDGPLQRRRQGLSPRVRGNLQSSRCGAGRCWSIPACAGEPYGSQTAERTRKVYPRVCGGTPRAASSRSIRWGLSPRVRGNPLWWSSGR